MKMECPYCGAKGTADDSLQGKTVRCGKCGKSFIAKATSEAATFTTEEKISVSCPFCGKSGQMDSSLRGRSVTCPACGRSFIVGEEKAAAGVGAAAPPPLQSVQPEEDSGYADETWKRDPHPLVVDFDTESLIRSEPNLAVWEVISETVRVGFSRNYFWVAIVCAMLLGLFSGVAQVLSGMFCGIFVLLLQALSLPDFPVTFAEYLVLSGFGGMLFAGLVWLAILHLRGEVPQIKMCLHGFAGYCRWELFKAQIVGTCLIFLGFMLFIIPGFYLLLGYFFVLPLVVDHGVGYWESLEISRKAVHRSFAPFSVIVSLFYLPMLLPVLIAFGPLTRAFTGLVAMEKTNPQAFNGPDGMDPQLVWSMLKPEMGTLSFALLVFILFSMLYAALAPAFKAVLYKRLFFSREEREEREENGL
ncbi:hypothetical protein JWG39_05440 [Desulforhopalus vacuolatus]|uniref:hypothetical protein n=1 Tax=Desulforhopalus vacuolatus TaxID=40414 RepID=UPI00196323B5|nr:hypothetical protein [Desulforhopalus vacuolatus]MBM9519264.1 hypothetical protein [Desulforhopalus vacuolatus]